MFLQNYNCLFNLLFDRLYNFSSKKTSLLAFFHLCLGFHYKSSSFKNDIIAVSFLNVKWFKFILLFSSLDSGKLKFRFLSQLS